MCIEVLSGVVAGRGHLRPSQTRSSLCVFPEPDGTQFLPLVLPINSQIATLRAPEVQSQLAGLFTTHRQRHSSVPAVGCLCHGHHANETTNKCLSAKQKGTKYSVCGVILTRHDPQHNLCYQVQVQTPADLYFVPRIKPGGLCIGSRSAKHRAIAMLASVLMVFLDL